MVEKCLMIATLAILVCHPKTTIKCFKPNPNTTSPQKERPKASHPKSRSQSKSKKEHHLMCSAKPESSLLPTMLRNGGGANVVVTELLKGNHLIGVLETILYSGWKNKKARFKIEKFFKVNQSVDFLKKFEEYRGMVKSKPAKACLAADGNELLMFHGAILTCSLGRNGVSTTCKKKSCGVCRMVTCSYSNGKGFLPFCENSWEAHLKVIADCAKTGVCSRKAMVVCRVIAGHVGRYREDGFKNGESCYDSLVCSSGNASNSSGKLLVLNPRAVLPCFVVMYNVG